MKNVCKILYPLQTSFIDYPDNSSLALTVCFVGCEHNCPFCHNKELQSLDYDNGVLEFENYDEIISFTKTNIEKLLERNRTNKLVLTGGDPLACFNREWSNKILETILDKIEVCIYTGYNIDQVKKMNLKFDKIKFFKCGRFDYKLLRESYKDDKQFVLASSNQNFYDNNFNQLSENGILKF